MKKIILVLMFIMLLASCSNFYETGIQMNDMFYVYYNEKDKTASISSLKILEFKDNYEITIPDEYNDCVIDELGYNYSNSKHKDGLRVYFSNDIVMIYSETNDSMELKPYRITINLNQYINKIYDVDYNNYYYHFEGEDVCYKIECYFIIPENNETFYSDNGNVYYKSNDSLVYKRWSLE